jgi:hypothetical protein
MTATEQAMRISMPVRQRQEMVREFFKTVEPINRERARIRDMFPCSYLLRSDGTLEKYDPVLPPEWRKADDDLLALIKQVEESYARRLNGGTT